VTTGLDTVRESSVQRRNRIAQKLTGLSLKLLKGKTEQGF